MPRPARYSLPRDASGISSGKWSVSHCTAVGKITSSGVSLLKKSFREMVRSTPSEATRKSPYSRLRISPKGKGVISTRANSGLPSKPEISRHFQQTNLPERREKYSLVLEHLGHVQIIDCLFSWEIVLYSPRMSRSAPSLKLPIGLEHLLVTLLIFLGEYSSNITTFKLFDNPSD